MYSRVPLKAGDVIVEYVGELIRPVVADKREKQYDARGIGYDYYYFIFISSSSSYSSEGATCSALTTR